MSHDNIYSIVKIGLAFWNPVAVTFAPSRSRKFPEALMSVVEDNKSTRLVTATTAGVQILAHSHCRRIRVGENFASADGPTTDLGQTAPVGATEVIIPKGTPCVFTAAGVNGAFYPGQVVGLVTSLDVAEVECQQIEDQLI